MAAVAASTARVIQHLRYLTALLLPSAYETFQNLVPPDLRVSARANGFRACNDRFRAISSSLRSAGTAHRRASELMAARPDVEDRFPHAFGPGEIADRSGRVARVVAHVGGVGAGDANAGSGVGRDLHPEPAPVAGLFP